MKRKFFGFGSPVFLEEKAGRGIARLRLALAPILAPTFGLQKSKSEAIRLKNFLLLLAFVEIGVGAGVRNSFLFFLLYFWSPVLGWVGRWRQQGIPLEFGKQSFLMYNLGSFRNHYFDTDFYQYV